MSEIQTNGKFCGLGCKKLHNFECLAYWEYKKLFPHGKYRVYEKLKIDKTANQIIRAEACLKGE